MRSSAPDVPASGTLALLSAAMNPKHGAEFLPAQAKGARTSSVLPFLLKKKELSRSRVPFTTPHLSLLRVAHGVIALPGLAHRQNDTMEHSSSSRNFMELKSLIIRIAGGM